jgi:hypothetical protein
MRIKNIKKRYVDLHTEVNEMDKILFQKTELFKITIMYINCTEHYLSSGDHINLYYTLFLVAEIISVCIYK